jgi:hypothetical protein
MYRDEHLCANPDQPEFARGGHVLSQVREGLPVLSLAKNPITLMDSVLR